jgi:hypothetical protein
MSFLFGLQVQNWEKIKLILKKLGKIRPREKDKEERDKKR